MERDQVLDVLQREVESARQRSEQLRQIHTHLPEANEQHLVFRMSLSQRELAKSLLLVANSIRNGWQH